MKCKQKDSTEEMKDTADRRYIFPSDSFVKYIPV